MGNAYKQAFSNFAYSSGEAVSAQSDAQNVDYGVGVSPVKVFRGRVPGVSNGKPVMVWNATPENVTSQFGNVAYPFGLTAPKKRQKALRAEAKKPKEGASYTGGPTRGVSSGGGLVGSAMRPSDALLNTGGTLEGQNEAAAGRFYIPQVG